MKKRISALFIAVIMLICCCVSVSAADPSISFESAYDSGKKVVTVTIFLENPVGLEAADLNLAYDTQMYEFVEAVEAEIGGDAMLVAGKAATDEGLVTCSVMFMEACEASQLDANGRLELATFTFSPRTADYDTEEFCYWASSYSVGNVNLADDMNVVGRPDLMEDKTDGVTYNAATTDKTGTTKGGTQGISGDLGSKWYVYVIAGVLAVGAIAGIAVVAIRSSHNEEENQENEENKEENAENSED